MVLRINKLFLTGFRNYGRRDFTTESRIIGICGPNGVGKTNLLEAIHYLSFTRPSFSRTDASSVQYGKEGFRIEGLWSRDNQEHQLVCILRENGKKEMWVDREACSRFSAHIGQFPVVMIAPDDSILITGGSSERRKFLDTLLSQLDAAYLTRLIAYNKVLAERNSLLKAAAESGQMDHALLDILDQQLLDPGRSIYESRKKFLETFIPGILSLYTLISGGPDLPEISYQSPLQADDFAHILAVNRNRDLSMQRTSMGIHKDEIDILLDGQPFRVTASQGQRKSLLFALKLAEYNVLKTRKGFAPLLLLDDIFEKLDERRMEQLLVWVCLENDGQVILTDTHCERIRQVMSKLGIDCSIISLP
jgi:DNA replication and repair protein RecF